ncbi:hypothetical protein EDC14_100160 [Hydrogenispora ethanolica]|jgi:hypothetical protein|uniref:DUF5362 domain-containing protein n=1 Tax=Hydrogenispora ethanolica TaxID=1082276 RepID=A0A4R1SCM7_HYDET|nr:DUF5362 family protein [Hydrogenispora ethanolica]TCL76780.1 hypothetical protein EDC14_100160 [Hydrogenispora ethanolica]
MDSHLETTATPEPAQAAPVPPAPGAYAPSLIPPLNGWATFLGVLTIIGGAMWCVGIITAAIGVPLIIAGVKLLKAVSLSKEAAGRNQQQLLGEVFANLNSYFKTNGIIIVISIGLSLILLALGIAFGLSALLQGKLNHIF